MKVVLPVAGNGTRLKPHTNRIQKALLPVAGKALLDHIVDNLHQHGIDKLVFIIGHLGRQIIDHMKKHDGDYQFVEQNERLGLGHAVLQGLEDVDEPVLVHLGDAVYRFPFSELNDLDVNGIAVLPVDDPQRFGVVELDNQNIIGFHEKVAQPPTNLAIIGLYYFQSEKRLKQAIEYLIENDMRTKGEYQITDAMQLMVDKGDQFRVLHGAKWYDAGVPETYLETNRILLESNHSEYSGVVINEPVYIGKNCRISSSNIGPHVTIMENCTIDNCRISDSIVLAGTTMNAVSVNSKIVGGDGTDTC